MDKTAAKAFAVLEHIAASGQPAGVTEIARIFGIPKSNAHRVLSTLVGLGYLRHRASGLYAPTLRMWEIGVQVLNRIDIKRLARPALEQVAFLTDETVHLTIPDGSEIIYLDKIESSRPVREFTRVGTHAPGHCTATGKVLLAFRQPIPPLPRLAVFTKNTIRDISSLQAELTRIRRDGFALNIGEYGAYVNGIAVPVADHTGGVVAAIVISGPAERLQPTRLRQMLPLLLKASQSISAELGFRGTLPRWPATAPAH
jgi:IclR family transcriptional regulator, KDG regulon repressor